MRLDLFALIGKADGALQAPRKPDARKLEEDCFFRPLPPKRDDEAMLRLARAV